MTKRELIAIVAAILHASRNGVTGYGEEDTIKYDVDFAVQIVGAVKKVVVK